MKTSALEVFFTYATFPLQISEREECFLECDDVFILSLISLEFKGMWRAVLFNVKVEASFAGQNL